MTNNDWTDKQRDENTDLLTAYMRVVMDWIRSGRSYELVFHAKRNPYGTTMKIAPIKAENKLGDNQ